MKNLWNRLEQTDKLAIGCIALYLSLYPIVDLAEAIAIWLFY